MIIAKPHKTYRKCEKPLGSGFSYFGGAEENRTPVRKPSGITFYGCSFIFIFPQTSVIKQTIAIGSFILQDIAQSFAILVHH